MPDITASDQFSRSIALDGNNVLIGAFGNDSDGSNVGRAYLFVPEPLTILGTANSRRLWYFL